MNKLHLLPIKCLNYETGWLLLLPKSLECNKCIPVIQSVLNLRPISPLGALSPKLSWKFLKALIVWNGGWKQYIQMWLCVCVHTYLDLTAGSAGWLTDFSHFLRGKVACTVAPGDYSSETEEHRKSINSWCYYLPTLWNPKWRLHIYKCSQHVTCPLSPFITNVCAASLIKVSMLLMCVWCVIKYAGMSTTNTQSCPGL